MKKKFFVPAAIAALMGVGAYFGHATATPDNASDLLLANAEALADDPEQGWDKNCEHRETFVCVLGPFSVIWDSISMTNPEYPGY